MAGKLSFNLPEFQQAAITYRGPLLKVPTLSIKDTLKYMTMRLGVRGTEIVGQANARAQLHPYRAGERQNVNLDLKLRALTTQFGTCNADFEPNSAISTVLGHRASQAMGDALKNVPTAKDVIALILKGVGEDLGFALWSGKRNENGKTTADLFDGFDTITEKEIAAGEISEEKGNLLKVEPITNVNAVDKFKDALTAMDPVLRREECFLFCSQEIADAYNEAYCMSHSGLVYNDKYEQAVVEGSSKRLVIVPLPEKAGSKYIHICPKSNMLVGVDQMSDQETLAVEKYAPDVLTIEMRAFFGVQFESLDKRRMLVVEVQEGE